MTIIIILIIIDNIWNILYYFVPFTVRWLVSQARLSSQYEKSDFVMREFILFYTHTWYFFFFLMAHKFRGSRPLFTFLSIRYFVFTSMNSPINFKLIKTLLFLVMFFFFGFTFRIPSIHPSIALMLLNTIFLEVTIWKNYVHAARLLCIFT